MSQSPPRTGLAGAVGLTITAAAIMAVLALLRTSTYDIWGALIVGPGLVLLSVPVLARQARREGDRSVLWFLLLALVVKLVGGLVRHFVAFDVYGGVADASSYDEWGTRLGEQFREGRFETGFESLTDTNFIRVFTGVIYALTGPTRLGGFLVYSWLGFWGLFFFYRAFTIAVPEGRSRTYARLVFFLPSLLFWPSSIGKEAWMVFALGIVAFGAAHLLSRRTWRGAVIASLGLWLAAIVRPHVAGMAGLALVAGFLFRRPRKELGLLAPLGKVVVAAVLALVAAVLVLRTDRFLRASDIGERGDVTSILRDVSERTETGGSAFGPSIVEEPTRAPLAVATVLFRPFITEAQNDQALVAAIEAAFLLGLSLLRIPSLLAAVRSVRRQPYVAFALAYTGLFIIGFSAVANFGLLARQRVQLLPFYLVLLAVPPPGEDRAAGSADEVGTRALTAPSG